MISAYKTATKQVFKCEIYFTFYLNMFFITSIKDCQITNNSGKSSAARLSVCLVLNKIKILVPLKLFECFLILSDFENKWQNSREL